MIGEGIFYIFIIICLISPLISIFYWPDEDEK